MPKGAHFKKDNPRIIQVSFKVNATEHEKIKNFAAKQNLSLPEWMRLKLVDGGESKQAILPEFEKPKVEKLKVEKAKVEKPIIEIPIEKTPVIKQQGNKEESKLPPNQMSLF